MEVRQVVNTVFKSCSYVIVHDGASWLVDCGDVDKILPLIDGQLKGVLLTHAHFDHIYGLNQLLLLYPEIQIYTNSAGRDTLINDKLNFSRYYGEPFILQFPEKVNVVTDGQLIDLFEDVSVMAIDTPGHSPCCVTWLLQDSLFTGDSYIPGVKTVTNIPHSNKALAIKSEARISCLAEHRKIYPGHAALSEL